MVVQRTHSNWWLTVVPLLWCLWQLGNRNSAKCIEILDENPRPVVARYIGGEQWYFEDDNAQIYRCTDTENWKRRNDISPFFLAPTQPIFKSSRKCVVCVGKCCECIVLRQYSSWSRMLSLSLSLSRARQKFFLIFFFTGLCASPSLTVSKFWK